MSKNTVIAKNIETLIKLQKSKIVHASALAKKMGVSKTTTTALLKDPDSSNPTLKKLQGMAESLKIELWMLFVEDFPFEVVNSTPLKKISASGYEVLCLFEQLDDATRKSVLDFIAYQVQGTRQEQQVRDVQAKYIKQPQSQGQSQITYPPCSEDFGKN